MAARQPQRSQTATTILRPVVQPTNWRNRLLLPRAAQVARHGGLANPEVDKAKREAAEEERIRSRWAWVVGGMSR